MVSNPAIIGAENIAVLHLLHTVPTQHSRNPIDRLLREEIASISRPPPLELSR
jgi:hypothetical protein